MLPILCQLDQSPYDAEKLRVGLIDHLHADVEPFIPYHSFHKRSTLSSSWYPAAERDIATAAESIVLV